MSNNPNTNSTLAVAFDSLEIAGTPAPDPAPIDTTKVNADAFESAGGLQVWNRGNAGIDAKGTYRTALGHEATAYHQNVALVWQQRCVPLGDFFGQVVTADLGKEDKSALIKDMSFVPHNGKVNLLVTPDGMAPQQFRMTPEALSQSARMAGVHMEVVKHFVSSERADVACDELNMMLDERRPDMPNDAARTLRIRADRGIKDTNSRLVRAVLSPGYDERLDNSAAMSMIIEALPSKDLEQVLCSHLYEDGDTITGNLLLPDSMKDYPDGAYGVGLAFRNSEIGDGSYSIDPFVFQAICVNGNIWSRQNSKLNVRQRHQSLDMARLKDEVAMAVENALSGGHKLIELMQRSRQAEVKAENVPALIAHLARQQKLSREVANAWYTGWQVAPDTNALGVVNGLTRAAQEWSGGIRRQLESTAMQVLAPSLEADLRSIMSRWEAHESLASDMPEEEVRRYVTVLA